MPQRRIRLSVLLAVVPLLCGCKPEEQIHTYTVDKVTEVESAESVKGKPERMLGAIMLPGGNAWFFKLTGPVEAVAEVENDVRAFVENVTFTDGKPTWTAPATWNQQPAGGMRFATLEIPQGEKPPLEMSVISLPQIGDDTQAYLLDNINRWRGQVNQAPLTAGALPVETESFEVDGIPTTWVDITGTSSGQSMGGPFMAGGAAPPGGANLPEGHPPIGPPSENVAGPESVVGPQPVTPRTAPDAAGNGMPFEKPDSWTQKAGSAFRKYAFDVSGDAGKGEVTVIQLGAAAGGTLANINRWRGQVKLPPLAEDQLDSVLEEIKVGETDGQLVEMVGTEQGILGVIISKPDATWFIKMTGDSALVKAERENFESFSKSLQLD